MPGVNMHKQIFIFAVAFFLTVSQSYSQNNELEELLKLDMEDLSDITVVSATKTLRKIYEVPATVRVITSETIKENGFLTLEDALSILPGFQFRNIQGFNSYVFQRGITSQNNLILLLVDGVQINELNSGGFYAGGQFNLNNVQQIEVVYGPASALYGTNAISGLINIITKDAKNSQGISVSGLMGSFKTYNGNIEYGYYDEENEVGLRIAAMAKTSEKADLAGAEGDNNWSSDMENFEDDYSVDIKGQYSDLTFGFTFQDKRASRTTNYKSVGTNYLDKNTLWDISFLNTYLKYNYRLFSCADMRSMLYYRNSTIADNTIAYITNQSQVGYYRPNSLIGFENMFSSCPLENLKLSGGLLFEYESLAENYSTTYSNSPTEKPPVPSSPEMENNTLLSLFLQANYKIYNSLSIFGGLRFDHSSIYNDVFTPRMGLIYNENKLTVKLLYAEAFRAPKPWDYKFGLGNPDLESENMTAMEAAATYSITEKFIVDLSVYKNKLLDLMVQETNESGSRSINKGDIEAIGMETSLEYKEKPFGAFFNYSYNSSEDENGQEIPEIAKHTINIGAKYYPFEDIELLLRGSYLGKRKNPKLITSTGSNYIDDAFILYSSVNYTGFEHFRISLIVNNLLNTAYYHTSNRPPDRYRQPQRMFLFRIEYNL
jgi:outer membrane receptor for ferrienterochelin and colicins